MKKCPTVAFIYDFDGTLSPKNMQEYDFLQAIGIKDSAEFWKESDSLCRKHDANHVLSYMALMLKKAQYSDVSITREAFRKFGESITLFKGVKEWFALTRQLGKEIGVNVSHYVNSSGLKEMIEGTDIYKEFDEVYACSFMYDANGVAFWPAVAVDFTAKTQVLFMINKGIRHIYDNRKVNDFMPESERPVPFRHMIYFGDGETDIPCMRLVKELGGNAIAVFSKGNDTKRKSAQQLVRDGRVNFACVADYSKDKEIFKTVETILRRIKSEWDFENMRQSNLNRFK